jgi:hypothetical protein
MCARTEADAMITNSSDLDYRRVPTCLMVRCGVPAKLDEYDVEKTGGSDV